MYRNGFRTATKTRDGIKIRECRTGMASTEARAIQNETGHREPHGKESPSPSKREEGCRRVSGEKEVGVQLGVEGNKMGTQSRRK